MSAAAKIAGVVSALLATAVYLNSLHGRFVFDDLPAISENPDVISPQRGLWDILHDNFWGQRMDAFDTQHQSFRPVTVYTFRLNHWIGGLDPFGYHVVNVALHAAVSALIPAVTLLFLPDASQIDLLLSGCLFAAHPIHTEAVSGLVGRAELLAGLFYVLAVIAYARAAPTLESWRFGPIARATFYIFLGTFSKEQGVTAAAACAAYDLLMVAQCTPSRLYALFFGEAKAGNRQTPTKGRRPGAAAKTRPLWAVQSLKRVSSLAGLTFLVLVVRLMQNKQQIDVDPKTNPANHIANPVHRILTKMMYGALHGWLMMVPNVLCCDWSGASVPVVESITDPRNLYTVGFYVVLVGGILAAYFLTTRPLTQLSLIAAAGIMITAFLPASGLFMEVGFVLAERVLYLPSIGYCILLIIIARLLVGGKPLSVKSLTTHALLVMLSWYCYRTILRNEDWKDELSVYRSGVQAAPLNAKLHHNYAYYLDSDRDFELKEHHLRKAIELYSPYISAYINLGVLISSRGRHAEAVKIYEEALVQHKIVPLYSTDVGLIYRNMAAAYMDMGQNSNAIAAYQNCLKRGTTRHDYCREMIAYLQQRQ